MTSFFKNQFSSNRSRSLPNLNFNGKLWSINVIISKLWSRTFLSSFGVLLSAPALPIYSPKEVPQLGSRQIWTSRVLFISVRKIGFCSEILLRKSLTQTINEENHKFGILNRDVSQNEALRLDHILFIMQYPFKNTNLTKSGPLFVQNTSKHIKMDHNFGQTS